MAIKAEICTLGNYLPWKLAITRWNRLRQRNMESNHIIYIYIIIIYIHLLFILFILLLYIFRNIFLPFSIISVLIIRNIKKKLKKRIFKSIIRVISKEINNRIMFKYL